MAAVSLEKLVRYLNDLLEVGRFKDYCPNGLQVEGKPHVNKLVSGVTASQDLLDHAVQLGADAVLVHHGYFWRGEPAELVGMKRARLKTLLVNDVSLLAYHLPLDAHREFGNNAALAQALGLQVDGVADAGVGKDILFYGRVKQAVSGQQLAQSINKGLGREPLHIAGSDSNIETIAWCTGGAQSMIGDAVELGVDAFLTGEVSEQTTHVARESNIHFFAAGHHATERYGVQALGNHLAQKFSIQYEHIEVDNPV